MSGWTVVASASAISVRAQRPPEFVISSFTSAVAPSDKIGKIKQGFICAPRGGLRFGELQQVDGARLFRRIADASAARGYTLEIADFRYPATRSLATRVLVGTLDSISLDLCVPGTNIGFGNRKSKGTGVMVVTWQSWHQADRKLADQQTLNVPIHLQGDDPRKSSDALEAYLVQSAIQFLDATTGRPSG